MDNFFNKYEKLLKVPQYGEVSHIFYEFNSFVENTFTDYNELDLVETSLVHCKGCNKNLKILIKKSLKFEKPTASIVYIHGGHALLVYVDKNYQIRGSELVVLNY